MTEKIIDYEAIEAEYGEMATMIIQNFESECFNQRMDAFLQGMIKKDWISAMTNSHTLKGSAGYIKANPFVHTVKIFQEFVKQHCDRIEYPDTAPLSEDRPQYKLKEDFDEKNKLQAYEYFHPIIEQARLLKKEMSKYTNSQFPSDIFIKEGEQIKQIHEEFKSSLDYQRRQTSVNQMGGSQRTIQSNNHIVGTLTRLPQNIQQGARPITMRSSVIDAVAIDPPQNTKCCEKCAIF